MRDQERKGCIKRSKVVSGVQSCTPTPLRADPRCVSGYVADYEQGARALGS